MAGNRLSTEILINLTGNLQAKARQYGASMSEFASRNQRAMSIVRATSEAAGRGLDKLGSRYTGLIAGVAGGAALREFAKTDRMLTELGIAAGKTREEMRQIFSDTQDASIKFRVDDGEVMAALSNVNKMTGDLDFGVKNKEMMAASIAASGSDGDSIGGLFASFQKFKTKNAQENLLAMDLLNQLGKEGGFELKDFAEKGTKIFSAYAGTGRTGPQALKEMGVVMESAMDAVGDKDLAATASFNLLNDLRNPKIAKILEASGVRLRDKQGNMLPINDIVKDIAQRSGKGGSKRQDERLAKAGFTDYSRLLISSVTTGKGAENFERYNAVVADGSGIMVDAEYAAKDFTSAMSSLNVTWKKFANSNLAEPVQQLADAINSMEPAAVQRWLEVGKSLVIAGAGIVAARKAFQIGKGTWDFFKTVRGKGGKGGVAGGIADVFGSGVMPVYVVNMGKDGLGNNAGSPSSDEASRTRNTPENTRRNLARNNVGNALSVGLSLMDNLPQSPEETQALIRKVQENNNRPTLWNDIKGWFSSDSKTQIVDPRPWAGMAPVTPNVNFASVPSSSNPKGHDIPQLQGNEHSLWAAITDFFMGANTIIESGMPSVKQQDNSPQLPPVPQKLQGEIRVVVEGDARVKSVKMDQPGVTLSASAGVSNVEQN